MEIDPQNLPSEIGILHQMLLELLRLVEGKNQLLTRVQHQLVQLLRYRYGARWERIDENQLFLFAAQIVGASQRASAPAENEATGSDSF